MALRGQRRRFDFYSCFSPEILTSSSNMSNIQSILKSEISRIARKEVKAETGTLKKSSTQYRSDIAALKRRLAALERLLKKQSRTIKAAIPVASEDAGEGQAEGLRFR